MAVLWLRSTLAPGSCKSSIGKIHMTRQHRHASDICKKLVFCLCMYDFPLDMNNLKFLHALQISQQLGTVEHTSNAGVEEP
jgi:hypothetical protein